MKESGGQIVNKVAYLRSAKVYNLRCRNKDLAWRNQS